MLPVGDVTARLEGLRRIGTAVLVDRSGAGSHISSVSMDDVAGGQFAVEHLIEQGLRRIAFLGVTALEIRAPRCAAR